LAYPRSGPNLNKIAAELGVSTATVSNALSGKGRVSAGLAERIRAKAEEVGYVPSQAARALRTGRTGVIGLVLPDIANPLFPQIAQAIEFAASNVGYGVLIADSRGDIAMQTEAVNRLLEQDVDGVVIVPRRGTRISDIGCPVAVIDSPSTPGNTVAADHWQGGQDVVEHLVGLGHRKLLLIGNNPASNVQNDRIGGMKSRIPADGKAEILWIETLEQERGQGCLLGLADKVAEGFTAFAVVSDLQALRALTELHRAGIGVPEEASITGFDDLVWSSVVTPGLTTVRMDAPRIAEIAVGALLRMIETGSHEIPSAATGTAASAETTKVPMKLVVRQTTAPAVRPASEMTTQSQGGRSL